MAIAERRLGSANEKPPHCVRGIPPDSASRATDGNPPHAVRGLFGAMLCLIALLPAGASADDLDTLEQQAVTAAVAKVAPSIVRIETVGGMERVERLLMGTGPTSGLVVDPQGYIVSSAFNFASKPESILVRLPDGTRKPARLVARDHNRKIVLLKIDVDRPLPVPETVPEAEMRIGQWCIAVGRTFEDERPNLSVGILSAVGRIWGKALQTDAAVSPNNYGGPLVDIRGRVLGVLVPLSPQSAEEVAGIEWYDSGIGFAIPLQMINKVLPRLRKGEDLHTGIMGIYLKSRNLYTGDTLLAACRPNSPADKAGFKSGDRIVEIDGRHVERAAEVRQEIARHDAGEKIRVVAMRDKERIDREVELVAKLQPYQHGFLGILPQRGDADQPLTVRYVYPDSPAAGAKIEPGDVIVSLGGKAVDNRDAMLHAIASLEPGMEAQIEVRHGDKTRKLSVKLASLPEGLPPESLPPAYPAKKTPEGDRPKVGLITLRVPEFKNEAWAYVPEGYSPDVPCGIVVWLHGTKAPDQKELLTQWKPWCDARDLVLVGPKAADASGWQVEEAGYLEKLVRQVENGYAIDAGSILPPPEAEPEHRLAVYVAFAKESRQAAFIGMSVARLRETKIPVTLKDLGREPRDLKPEEMEELVRWIDMLDRI